MEVDNRAGCCKPLALLLCPTRFTDKPECRQVSLKGLENQSTLTGLS